MALADKVSASQGSDVYPDPYPHPHPHPKPVKPVVNVLPATGVAEQDKSSIVAPLAAGAAAAALVALRMRQPKKAEGEL